MWLEDSDLLDRNAIRAGMAGEKMLRVRPVRPARTLPARGGSITLAWLAGWRPRKLA